ncbi:MAG: MraZ N-terminal domain containing protein, partial [Candidatus Azobacteroides sp.]|nr:MraZ N-terminal domain containing protein [Candidatus Azobacteroides sp.]
MDVFTGTIHAKTDVKGRVFLPASFRKILQSFEGAGLKLRKDIHQD